MSLLTISNHSREYADMKYVYPVFSRRSGGLSIGINLNTNHACNWQCIYCQVPELIRGRAPHIDLTLLHKELYDILEDVIKGDFFQRYEVPSEKQQICDIAISGNGEPTSSPTFEEVTHLVGSIRDQFALTAQLVLITNGSLLSHPRVRKALLHWNTYKGEVWFKVDSATREGIQRINQVDISPERMCRHIETCVTLCSTWIQTCFFALDEQVPSLTERKAYLHFLESLKQHGIPLKGIHLYGLARESRRPDAARLSKLSPDWFAELSEEIKSIGFAVCVNV